MVDDAPKRDELCDALRALADAWGLSPPSAATSAAEADDDAPQARPDNTAAAAQSPVLNDRDNFIALVDEAHRTQEGDLGMKMRAALPNAFLFGLTGTPINRQAFPGHRRAEWLQGHRRDLRSGMLPAL